MKRWDAVDAFIHFHDRAILAFQRGGTLVDVRCEEGDSIEADQVLAKIDDRVTQKAFEIADARAGSDVQVRVARAEYQLAKREYESVVAANRQAADAYPAAEIERRRSAMETAELSVELAEHELEIARLTRDQALEELHTYQLKSPFDGVVARVHLTRGNSTNVGEKVLEVVNTKRIRVHGYVSFRHAWNVKAGDKVVVTVANEEIAGLLSVERFEGKVIAIDTSAEVLRNAVGVTAIVENTGGQLKDGLAVHMKIVLGSSELPRANN